MNSGSHCVYEIRYHVIWCPKFRYKVLENYETELKNILLRICDEYHYTIEEMEIMPDHIHLLVSAPQTVAPCDVVRTLKSLSAVEMLNTFPQLKRFYARCGKLWSRSYYVGTVGHANEEKIKKYIQNQKKASKNRI